ncbi:hypothetical protein PIB30_076631 [Stylosanthes scabra]|uniref:Uncharacterized protein n=1 Tax=Stylosanthes scabra TaxID=79078 RepID=A0ABU6QRJ7_9FABA|nr:hypothetical protein [Stylosanthes scabra]
MDLLRSAYDHASDDEDHQNPQHPPPQPKRQRLSLSSSFYPPKPYLPPTTLPQSSSLNPNPNPIPGSYVSKRQRALLAPHPHAVPIPLHSSTTLSATGSISDDDIPRNVLSLLKKKPKCHQNPNSMPEKLSAALCGHTKAVNAIHWSSSHELDYRSSPCICWDGSYGLRVECMEQRSEASARAELPQSSSERCEMVSTRALSTFMWV